MIVMSFCEKSLFLHMKTDLSTPLPEMVGGVKGVDLVSHCILEFRGRGFLFFLVLVLLA